MGKNLTDPQRSTVIDLIASGHQMEAAQYVQAVLNCDTISAIDVCDEIARDAVETPVIHPKTPAEKA